MPTVITPILLMYSTILNNFSKLLLVLLLSDTTDVQAVTVVISGEYNAKHIILHCDYIANTDAQGCMVELRDGSETVSINMSRNSNDECFTIAPLNAAILDEALGFDIEFDGSIGGVAIPGEVVQDTNAVSECDSEQTISQPPSSSSENNNNVNNV